MYTDPRGGHNRKEISLDFFKKWSSQMSYVTGFIFADGAIEDVQKSSRSCYLAISSVDYSLIKDIRDTLSSNHRIYEIQPRLQKFPDNKTYLTSKKYLLRIGSKSIYNDLIAIGVTPRKSLTLTLPFVPTKYFSYFLRGYFDGDGCINLYKKGDNKPRLTTIFTCGSKKFLFQINSRLKKTIKTSNKNIVFQGGAYRLRYNKTNSLKLLRFMYKNLEKAPFLDRKYNKYQAYLETL